MRRRSFRLAAHLLLTIAGLSATRALRAQPLSAPAARAEPDAAQRAVRPPEAPAATTGEPAATVASVPGADENVGLPPGTLREINDPMLVPMPRAARELSRWQDALKMIRQRSTTLRAAYAQVEVARGESRQALAGALPKLTGDALLTHHLLRGEGFNFVAETPDTQNLIAPQATYWTAGATLSVPVLAARTWYDYGTSRDAVKAASLDTREVERQVIGALAESIVAVVTAERLAEVTRVTLRYALSTLDLNERRARLGAASQVDVLRAQTEVSLSRAQVIDADEVVHRSREALGLALGFGEAWGVNPNIKLDPLRADARATCSQGRTIEDRPDVRAAIARLGVASRNVTSVDYSYLPEVDALSVLQYHSNERTSPNQNHLTWTIGGALIWHLYDGGFRYGEKRANAGLRDIAKQETVETKRQASIEVTRAFRDVNVAKARLDVTKQRRDVARASAKLSQLKFVNGTGTSFDMVDTLRSLREAELDVTVDEFALFRAEIAAFLALATCDV